MHRTAAALLTILLVAVACGGGAAEDEPANGVEVAGDVGRIDPTLAEALNGDDVAELAAAVNAFGLRLHTADMPEDDAPNRVTSPLSVATLLATVLAGADGDTADEMATMLGLPGARDERLGGLLRRLGTTNDVDIAISNGVFVVPGVGLVEEFERYVDRVFGATARETDLTTQAGADELDEWVVERTGGRIDGIAESLELPRPNVVAVLANAVHFLGQWTVQFDPDDTSPGTFTRPDGTTVEVPMMRAGEETDLPRRIAYADGYSVLQLPYGEDGRFVMRFVLPDEGRTVDEVLASLDAATLGELSYGLEPEVPVAIPLVEVAWTQLLNKPLQDLGMACAFDGTCADFTRMLDGGAAVGAVAHRTYLRIDEAGTEAAAVTAASMDESAVGDFLINRPYALALTDTETGVLLFLGTITDPSATP